MGKPLSRHEEVKLPATAERTTGYPSLRPSLHLSLLPSIHPLLRLHFPAPLALFILPCCAIGCKPWKSGKNISSCYTEAKEESTGPLNFPFSLGFRAAHLNSHFSQRNHRALSLLLLSTATGSTATVRKSCSPQHGHTAVLIHAKKWQRPGLTPTPTPKPILAELDGCSEAAGMLWGCCRDAAGSAAPALLPALPTGRGR